jgi:hypothetical protein
VTQRIIFDNAGQPRDALSHNIQACTDIRNSISDVWRWNVLLSTYIYNYTHTRAQVRVQKITQHVFHMRAMFGVHARWREKYKSLKFVLCYIQAVSPT